MWTGYSSTRRGIDITPRLNSVLYFMHSKFRTWKCRSYISQAGVAHKEDSYPSANIKITCYLQHMIEVVNRFYMWNFIV
jgi:hypothetical protein